MSRVLRYGLLFAIALSGVLLFILASASGNTAFFERNYPILLAVNGVIAAALAVLVLLLVRRLAKRLLLKRFGARLTTRFAVAFALMGVLPGVLIYIVSTQFLSRSIESWFDIRVDRALDSGLTLGRAALDNVKNDVAAQGARMGARTGRPARSRPTGPVEPPARAGRQSTRPCWSPATASSSGRPARRSRNWCPKRRRPANCGRRGRSASLPSSKGRPAQPKRARACARASSCRFRRRHDVVRRSALAARTGANPPA